MIYRYPRIAVKIVYVLWYKFDIFVEKECLIYGVLWYKKVSV